MLLTNARIVLPDRIQSGSVRIRAEHINALGDRFQPEAGEAVVDLRGLYLAPGFIDLHMHVGLAYPDRHPEYELELCGKNLPANGTTRFLPTLISALRGDLPLFFDAIRSFVSTNPAAARPLGVHLEGPYIAAEVRGGFHPSQIATPREFSLQPILNEGSDLVRIVSLSPELPGCEEVIRDCVQRGIVVGLCHTLGGEDIYLVARRAGATHITHTYNNRRTFPDSPLGGRAFNLDDLGVADDDVTCELICDGTHVKPVWIKTIYRTKGPDKICLITDSFSAGRRSAEGETFQTPGGTLVTVRNGVGRDPKGGLAGSVLTQDQAIRVFMQHAGCPLPEAIRCASLNPARVLKVQDQLGSIEAGKGADLVVLDEELLPVMTLVAGCVAFDRRSQQASARIAPAPAKVS
ncbi:MAG: N-acetylglucosamine-6-phosphate deacetylase [Acidimicrobiia bacterium]|nr:N-acetylglucosamine-6-phosphate deacetylase [Acidimicrobiia bacterium]